MNIIGYCGILLLVLRWLPHSIATALRLVSPLTVSIPILPAYSAVFECRIERRYTGGDHMILVARVLRFEARRADPMIFYRGHLLE